MSVLSKIKKERIGDLVTRDDSSPKINVFNQQNQIVRVCEQYKCLACDEDTMTKTPGVTAPFIWDKGHTCRHIIFCEKHSKQYMEVYEKYDAWLNVVPAKGSKLANIHSMIEKVLEMGYTYKPALSDEDTSKFIYGGNGSIEVSHYFDIDESWTNDVWFYSKGNLGIPASAWHLRKLSEAIVVKP